MLTFNYLLLLPPPPPLLRVFLGWLILLIPDYTPMHRLNAVKLPWLIIAG